MGNLDRESLTGVSGVYILQFDTPIAGHAHYYVGYSRNIGGRLYYHECGRGAAITRAAVQQGITWSVVCVFVNANRDFERRIKRRRATRRFLERHVWGNGQEGKVYAILQ